MDFSAGESDAASSALDRDDDARIAGQALAQIRPEQRRLILLNVVEGLTHQEIATATGMPLGTIKTRMRLAMQKLKGRLQILREEAR